MYPFATFHFGRSTYRWSGWFGCQLESMEWRTVPAGTTRDLDFGPMIGRVTVKVFSTRRVGIRVRTTWAVSASGTHAEHEKRIYDLRDKLTRLI